MEVHQLEEVNMKDYISYYESREGLTAYTQFYNGRCIHQASINAHPHRYVFLTKEALA